MKHEASYPAYLALAATGDLRRRAREAVDRLSQCRLCPRHCGVDRSSEKAGVCRIGRQAYVASYFPHFGEEDCLRGTRGSGTIFFSGCNLRCAFCQNWDTSQRRVGTSVEVTRLAGMMLELQAAGCHNINWVTPSHVVPQVLEALAWAAEKGLHVPVVYNSSAYDDLKSLQLLDGVVDIYMPDFKYWEAAEAARLSKARDYPEVARTAIREMHRQVGDLVQDESGIARRGLLVRHLVLPEDRAGTPAIARWLAEEISDATWINIMGQYQPAGLLADREAPARYSDLRRPLRPKEHKTALEAASKSGLWRFDCRHVMSRRFSL